MLLLLMSTRGRCHPRELAASEFEAHRVGRGTYVLGDTRELPGFLMDLTSQDLDNCHGQLCNRDTHPDQYASLESRHYQQPFYGLIVLEAQNRVLSFLVECSKLILHDFVADGTLLTRPVQSAPNPPIPATGFASLATMAAEAPYRRPAAIDLTRIASLLAAKRDQAADHLWSLREDPGYYETHMTNCKEHRIEMVLCPNGSRHPILESGKEDVLWARVITDHICNAYTQLAIFDDLQNQAVALEEMWKQYKGVNSESPDFRKSFTAAAQRFRSYLYAAVAPLGEILADGFCASPLTRQYHRLEVHSNRGDNDQILRIKSFHEHPTCGRLTWLISRLRSWYDDDLCRLLGLTNVVDELRRLIDTNGTAKSLISDHLASNVSDFAIISECVQQLEMFQPWMDHDSKISAEDAASLRIEYRVHTGPWFDFTNAIERCHHTLGSMGAPKSGRFTYPFEKPRNGKNVALLKNAEKNLDEFWHKIDQETKRWTSEC